MVNENVAIIPARGGSKGIPNKNIINLGGKPLLTYTIEAALTSKCFKKIYVVTDSIDIINVALNYEIQIIKMPDELAQDNSKMIEVILYVLEFLTGKEETYDLLTLLQPTSPLRTDMHIKRAIDILINQPLYNSLVSFCESKEHPYKSFYLREDNKLEAVLGDENVSMPRQLLPRIIKQNGAIYINKIDNLLEGKSFFNKPVYPFMMDDISSIDIDSPLDLSLCELILNDSIKE